ncbi:glycosyl transferase family group 2-domain-containing protein [Lyophyllum atratum]|nr:glycosyl transferase family group 2-domain-containing protein [Lyophyllum atratum]
MAQTEDIRPEAPVEDDDDDVGPMPLPADGAGAKKKRKGVSPIHPALPSLSLKERQNFLVFPYENPALIPFEAAVRGLNPVVAVKLRSSAVPRDNSIYIDQGTRIQILESIDYLPQAEKDQCGTFIRDQGALILWSYALETMIPLCKDFDEKLIKHIWHTRKVARKSIAPTPLSASATPAESTADLNGKEAAPAPMAEKKPAVKRGWWSWHLQPRADAPAPSGNADPEKGRGKRKERKLILLGPLYAGCGGSLYLDAAKLMVCRLHVGRCYGAAGGVRAGWDPRRFALLVTLPIIFCVSLVRRLAFLPTLAFPAKHTSPCPCSSSASNSSVTSLSCTSTSPPPLPSILFRHTILTLVFVGYSLGPVAQYHENSQYYSAIKPEPNAEVNSNLPHITIQLPVYKESLELVMYLISEEDREQRIVFYANHNIGWVARPGHESKEWGPGHESKEWGFKRAGKFKKASNMNYGLAISPKLEKFLAQLIAEGAEEDPGDCLEDKARPLCMNGKSMRVGEIILIIDSDTIVPEDCFHDAAREMWESPDVAIIQHESDVMQVAYHYFENGITHFTRRINRCISLGCANGEVTLFVGQNAFLRWSAVQDAAFVDPADGKRKQWSEEGVSLTVVDELARWQKCAYGCNEIISNPLVKWWKHGPISPQLRGFVWSRAPVHYKIGMMSDGIAAATVGSILNYLLLRLAPQLDRFYLHSFEILLACTVVFSGVGNLGYTLLEYRLGHRKSWRCLDRAAICLDACTKALHPRQALRPWFAKAFNSSGTEEIEAGLEPHISIIDRPADVQPAPSEEETDVLPMEVGLQELARVLEEELCLNVKGVKR